MTKELIERYLQFAIDNWFAIEENYWDEPHAFYTLKSIMEYNIIETITSWSFIEAISKGIWVNFTVWRNEDMFEAYMKAQTEYITHKQADAIRDNKLDEFIKDLLPKN